MPCLSTIPPMRNADTVAGLSLEDLRAARAKLQTQTDDLDVLLADLALL